MTANVMTIISKGCGLYAFPLDISQPIARGFRDCCRFIGRRMGAGRYRSLYGGMSTVCVFFALECLNMSPAGGIGVRDNPSLTWFA